MPPNLQKRAAEVWRQVFFNLGKSVDFHRFSGPSLGWYQMGVYSLLTHYKLAKANWYVGIIKNQSIFIREQRKANEKKRISLPSVKVNYEY